MPSPEYRQHQNQLKITLSVLLGIYFTLTSEDVWWDWGVSSGGSLPQKPRHHPHVWCCWHSCCWGLIQYNNVIDWKVKQRWQTFTVLNYGTIKLLLQGIPIFFCIYGLLLPSIYIISICFCMNYEIWNMLVYNFDNWQIIWWWWWWLMSS